MQTYPVYILNLKYLMHCIYTDNMFYGYSAIGRYASDAPIGDSISDVTEYRKKPTYAVTRKRIWIVKLISQKI